MTPRSPLSKRPLACVLALLALQASCFTNDPSPADTELDRWFEEELAASEDPTPALQSALPRGVERSLLPPLRLDPSAATDPLHQRFDVTVNDADAREFFLSLVEGTPVNIVLDPAVKGDISLTLQNVTIEQVLAAVEDVYGYEYRKTSYGYHILPGGLQTRVFRVDYLNVTRKGASQTRVSSGQVSGSGSSGSGSSGGGGGGGNASDGADAGRDNASTSGSSILTTSATDFWAELEEGLFAIIGDGDSRSVTLSPNSGLVTVRAAPAELHAVEAFLGELQDAVSRQVILEAKILEVTLNDGFQSGVDYTQFVDTGSSTTVQAFQAGAGGLVDNGVSELAGSAFPLDPSSLANPATLTAPFFGGASLIALESDNFEAFIELLETQGTVRTLSNPRVSTVNNQKAVIKVGSDEFFVTSVSSTTVTSGGATTQAPEVELTPFFSGIALDVTPQIGVDGSVILHVHPAISQVQDQIKTFTVGGTPQTFPLAQSTIRESDSIVRTRGGQVIVIGGLMQNTETLNRAGTPILGKIPLLGFFFRQQKDSFLTTELVILLRATVVEGRDWHDVIRRTRDQMRRTRDRGTPTR